MIRLDIVQYVCYLCRYLPRLWLIDLNPKNWLHIEAFKLKMHIHFNVPVMTRMFTVLYGFSEWEVLAYSTAYQFHFYFCSLLLYRHAFYQTMSLI